MVWKLVSTVGGDCSVYTCKVLPETNNILISEIRIYIYNAIIKYQIIGVKLNRYLRVLMAAYRAAVQIALALNSLPVEQHRLPAQQPKGSGGQRGGDGVGGTGVKCDAANGRHIWQLFKCDNNNVPKPIEETAGGVNQIE